jgi:hypothetical protein
VMVRSSRLGRIGGNCHTVSVVAGERVRERAVNRQPLFARDALPSARAEGGTALRSALPVLENPANRSRAVSESAAPDARWAIRLTASRCCGPRLVLLEGRPGGPSPAPCRPGREVRRDIRRHSEAVSELVELDDRGHSLVIDSGRPDVAGACLQWLRERGL